jgi:hypothetical protein
MPAGWSTREYQEGDEHDIIDLFSLVFSRNVRDLNYWIWEFKNNPDGFKAFLATDGERIAGHLGALQREISVGNIMGLAALEVDGMTHPDYCQQGIFTGLGGNLLSVYKREGYHVVIGFPNQNAMAGHRKLGCIELFIPTIMIRPFNFRAVSQRVFKNGFLRLCFEVIGGFVSKGLFKGKKTQIEKDITIRTISKIDDRFNRLWEEASSAHNVILKRDREYLDWRYIKHPSHDYDIFIAEKDRLILSYIVVRVMEYNGLRNGVIVDTLAVPDSEDVMAALTDKVIEHLCKEEVDLIVCMVPKWCEYRRVLRKCGFWRLPTVLKPRKEPFIIYPLSQKKGSELIKSDTDWYITWGDTDVV